MPYLRLTFGSVASKKNVNLKPFFYVHVYTHCPLRLAPLATSPPSLGPCPHLPPSLFWTHWWSTAACTCLSLLLPPSGCIWFSYASNLKKWNKHEKSQKAKYCHFRLSSYLERIKFELRTKNLFWKIIKGTGPRSKLTDIHSYFAWITAYKKR